MKRFILLLAAVVLIMSMAVTACAQRETSGDYEYVILDDGSVEIVRYIGESGNIEIPSQLERRTVTSIGKEAFYRCDVLTSVTIPASVMSVGRSAFSYCKKLTTVKCNGSVIGEYAFSSCYNLISVDLSGVSEIGDGAFSYSALATVTLPDSLVRIGNGAFESCKFSSVVIPGTVTDIGENVFHNNEKLTEATLMPGLQAVADGMFSGCSKLIKVTIPDSVISIGNSAFSKCFGLAAITLPKNLELIGESAFAETGLSEIKIPDSVHTIEKQAFYNVDNLSSFAFPEGMTTVSAEMFWNCNELQNVSLPDSIISIGHHAFCNCPQLKTIHFPSSLTSIGDSAFHSSGLTNVRLPEGVTSISGTAFYSCRNLEKAYIPASVSFMESSSFGENWNMVAVVPQGSFAEVYCISNGISYEYPALVSGDWEYRIQEDGSVGICGYLGSETALTVPGLLDGMTVSAIHAKAFRDNKFLSSVLLPEGVTLIAEQAFWGCSNLKTVTLPGTLAIIGDEAFGSCASLASVKLPDQVTSLGQSMFKGCASGFTIFVQSGTVTANTCDSRGINYEIPHSVSGNWEYAVLKGDTAATVWYCGSDANVTVPTALDGIPVQHVGERAFYGNKTVESVVIPEGILSVRASAFEDCTKLVSVSLPESLQSVSRYAMIGTRSTLMITAPESSFAESFCRSEGLTYVPPAVVSGDWLYMKQDFFSVKIVGYQGNAKTVKVPNELDGYSVKAIGKNAFADADQLKEIWILENVQSIEDGAFADCENVSIFVQQYSYVEDYCRANGIAVKYKNMFQRLVG